MAIDAPTFPGELLVSLVGATVTSADCTNPANAIDNDSATFAAFPAIPVVTVDVPLDLNTWTNLGVVVPSGATRYIRATGSGIANDGLFGGANRAVTPEGTTPAQPIEGEFGPDFGYWAAQVGENVTGYCLVIAAQAAALTNQRDLEPTSLRRVFCPGNDVLYEFTNNRPESVTLYAQFNGLGNYYDDYSGTFTVEVSAANRFLRVDWGEDKFITRVRLRMAGDVAVNAAVALESGFEDEADVPIPYIPLPSDENSGNGVDEITLDLPQLATGVTFYPDYLSNHAVDTGTVNLYQIQIYESEWGLSGEKPMANPTQTTKKRKRVGVKQIKFYPWNGITGPYDVTTASEVFGIQGIDCVETITVAKVTGSETTHPLGAHETAREGKYKVTAAISDLRILALLTGDKFIVSPPSGGLDEVQYITPEFDGRAPYFRVIFKSTNGEGADNWSLLKCKVEGGISYNMTKDQATNLEFEFCTYWDDTYVRQDGTTGGVVEKLFGANGESAMHS